MTVSLSREQQRAMRKHAMASLRKLNFSDLERIELHRLDWSDLNARAKAVKLEARAMADRISDDLDKSEAAEIEAAYDGLTEILDAIEDEKDKRSELGNRGPREHGGDLRRPGGAYAEARGADDGRTFTPDLIDVASTGLTREMRMADHVRKLAVPRHEGLTPGAYLRAMFTGAKTDAEHRALSEGTNSAGGFTVPDILSSQFIDAARKAATVFRAGAITVPLSSDNLAIAKVATDPVPAWRNENAAVAESDPTFAQVTFTPRSLAVLVKVSREVLMDSINMETLLPSIMASAMAVELDRVALFGSGSAPEPKGIVNITGVEEVAHDDTLDSYTPLISARTKVKTNNHPDVTAYIMHPRDEGVLASLAATDGQPLMVPPAIANIPMLASTSVPTDEGSSSPPNESSIITGDFSKLMIGIRHEIQIEVLRELYAGNGQIGFIAHLRADVAATYENAFCKITGITPA
ncbi:phage major capsid protein [Zhengella sp. ZM62]|uniref:phage major capsid protein n=1 Tax=Zhengella sedimenti TaxID=3390035 RepID=UPI0039751CDD